jgi:alpha-galactosidase
MRQIVAGPIEPIWVVPLLTLWLYPPAVAIDNGLARTPPMTWSSWGSFGCDVDEQSIKETADLFVKLGLADAGYSVLQIDDCWSNQTHRSLDVTPKKRGEVMHGELMANRSKFPSGTLIEVSQYVAALGLRLGIYTDIGLNTCAGFPGSFGHYCEDAATFARCAPRTLPRAHPPPDGENFCLV